MADLIDIVGLGFDGYCNALQVLVNQWLPPSLPPSNHCKIYTLKCVCLYDLCSYTQGILIVIQFVIIFIHTE